MQRTARRASSLIALALLALGLFAVPARAGTPHVNGTDPACPADFAQATQPCWVEYVSEDGLWVPALLFPPTAGPEGPRVPSTRGLVFVHGGFDRSVADSLDDWQAGQRTCDECPRIERLFALAGLGYWILGPDYRGSGSHSTPGRDVSDPQEDDLAGLDVADSAYGADFLKTEVGVTSVVIFGGSRGGWLAAGATYRYDDKADGIAVISGGCDWISVYPLLSDGEQRAVDESFGGPPDPPIPQAYYDRSACYHFTEMDKPVLIMHGTDDAAFPVEQARMFRDGMVTANRDHDYFEYDAGHTFFFGQNTPFGEGHWVDFLAWIEEVLGTNTVITSGPPPYTRATTNTFLFSDTAGAATGYQCRLDGGAWTACVSPPGVTYTNQVDGETHTFEVRAQLEGQWDPTPAERTWTVDLADPDTTILSGPANPTQQSKANFTFTSNEPFPSFRCELDGAPLASCVSGTEYTGFAQGPHTFKAWASDAAGNEDDTPAIHTWVMDTGAPTVTIDSGPSGTVTTTDATFTFSANETVAWMCKLDAGSYAPCSSPKSYAGLASGSHTFTVQATDLANNVRTKSRTWTISAGGDTDPPETTIDSGPTGTTSSTSATFTFSTDESGSTFQCRLDWGAWAGCATPKEYTGLAEGSHTFEVKATDAALNEDPTPASRTWTVSTGGPDTTPPETTIDSGPSGTVASSSATFTFSANEPATFKCKLDGTAWATCTPPREYTGLADGPHTFKVRATDTAGNVDGSAATRAWTVSAGGGDVTPPDTTITSGPPATTTEDDATFEFTSSEPDSSFECRRRRSGTGYATCTSPHTIWDLPSGTYTVDVRATDAAGNTDPTPYAWSWQIVNAMAPWTQRL